MQTQKQRVLISGAGVAGPTLAFFLERAGFEVTGEINIPGGPTLWPMWRKART